MVIVNMSKHMKGSLPYLQILAKAKLKLRKILIENVPESVTTAICECCLNLLRRAIPLTPCQMHCLAPYSFSKSKKTYLTQRGGALLQFVLPAALGALGSLF